MPTSDLSMFDRWVVNHARGTLNDELTLALAEVTQTVSELHLGGKVTLTLSIEPAGSGGRTVKISGKVKSAPPVPPAEESIFFVGEHGSLHRDDPYRSGLFDTPARSVDPMTGEMRDGKLAAAGEPELIPESTEETP